MWRRIRRAEWGTFQLAGWLFTDLLLAMMMVFLVSAKDGVPNITSSQRPVGVTPTPRPQVCGIDPKFTFATVTTSNPVGVRNQSSTAMSQFYREVTANKTLRGYTHKVAGVVEVFGGSSDVNDGTTFATGAIAALKAHSNGQFIFSSRTVYFKPLWDGKLPSNQVKIYVFFYILAASCGST